MPLETELKLRVESHEPVRERLRSLGATFLGCVVESNTIFDHPDGSLRQRGCGLRIRQAVATEGGECRTTLTAKGPRLKGKMKSREEQEVRVDDGNTAARMLGILGFVPILRYKKRRESWQLDRCRIELDEPPHVGLYIEIEGPDEKTIKAARKSLGLKDAKKQQASYVRMLLTYCKEHGIESRILDL